MYRECELDDFHNAAIVGVLTAARRFDKRHGVKFMTYAGWYIRNECQDLVRRSRGLGGDHRNKLAEIPRLGSLDVPVGDSQGPLVETLGRPEGEKPSGIPEDFWDRVASLLSPRAFRVVRLRAEGKTLAEVGEAMGVTRERIRQIQRKAIDRLIESGKMNPEWLL